MLILVNKKREKKQVKKLTYAFFSMFAFRVHYIRTRAGFP